MSSFKYIWLEALLDEEKQTMVEQLARNQESSQEKKKGREGRAGEKTGGGGRMKEAFGNDQKFRCASLS